MIYKANESVIVIQAEAVNPIQTGVVFWSHDRGTAKLRFKLQKDGVDQNLPEGTTVPIRLIFKSATAQGGYGKHDYLATIEDRLNGIVSIVLEDNILGYQGRVDGSIYIEFPNDQSLDTAGRFSFAIKRSPIDDTTPELENYYFNGFSQTIDKIEKMIADAKAEIDGKITASSTEIDKKIEETNNKITKANQDIATINSDIDKANNRIDQTNQQIGDLGKLKKMYANSIDFGGYDYLGNPNLMPYITDPWTGSLLANGTTTQENRTLKHIKTRFTDDGDVLSLGFGIPRTAAAKNSYLINGLAPSTKYSITVKINVGEDWTGGTETIGIRLRYLNSSGGTEIPVTAMLSTGLERNKFHTLTATGTTKADLTGMSNCYIQVFSTKAEYLGTVTVDYDIKLEKGDPSPYQPNLLDAPYYLSKVPLGENIANKSVAFPIITSDYKIYGASLQENWQAGQIYTLTMKATKTSTQSFNVFMNSGTMGVGPMVPVEGKTDVWQKTFTISQANIDAGVTNVMAIYQVPSSTAGTVQIEWLKLEKSDTATPNISMFKYFGEGLKDSNNPNDYSWDITPEYAEKTMNGTVNLSDSQTVLGVKNFSDGIQVAGTDVATRNQLNLYGIYGEGPNQSKFPNGSKIPIGKLTATDFAHTANDLPYTISSDGTTLTATRACILFFEGTIKIHGDDTLKYAYVKIKKNGSDTNFTSLGSSANFNYMSVQAGQYVHTLAKGDKVEFTIETASGGVLFALQFLSLKVSEVKSV
jgi:hypothetical protein